MTGLPEELLTVAETMAILRIKERHDIYKMIDERRLEGTQLAGRNGRWLITRSSVEALMPPSQRDTPQTPE